MLIRARGVPERGLSASDWALWRFHSDADEQLRLFEAWRERHYQRHALIAVMTHDEQTAQRAWQTLSEDTPPPLPWQTTQDEDEERWSEGRLEADLLMGVRWPFFRDKTHERAMSNGHDAHPHAAEETGL